MKNTNTLIRVMACCTIFAIMAFGSVLCLAAEKKAYEVSERIVSETRNDVAVSGVIPVVSMPNKELANKLNELIAAQYAGVLTQTADRQAEVVFSFECIENAAIVSILMYSDITSGSSASLVKSFNFNSKTHSIVTINDVLGINGVKLANKVISEEINKDIDNYKANFTGIKNSRTFYVKDDVLYVVFDKGEISHGYNGIVKFGIGVSGVVNVYVYEYKTKTAYNTKMIMLREVAEQLGLILEWEEKTSSVTVYTHDKQFITRIVIGQNSYAKANSNPFTLEAAPEIENGRTYVPLSFFDEVLDLPYSVDDKGAVIISQYAK